MCVRVITGADGRWKEATPASVYVWFLQNNKQKNYNSMNWGWKVVLFQLEEVVCMLNLGSCNIEKAVTDSFGVDYKVFFLCGIKPEVPQLFQEVTFENKILTRIFPLWWLSFLLIIIAMTMLLYLRDFQAFKYLEIVCNKMVEGRFSNMKLLYIPKWPYGATSALHSPSPEYMSPHQKLFWSISEFAPLSWSPDSPNLSDIKQARGSKRKSERKNAHPDRVRSTIKASLSLLSICILNVAGGFTAALSSLSLPVYENALEVLWRKRTVTYANTTIKNSDKQKKSVIARLQFCCGWLVSFCIIFVFVNDWLKGVVIRK